MITIRIISALFILTGLIMMFTCFFLTRKNNNLPKKSLAGHNFCFLIPARYESSVIEGLLISIKNQSVKVNMSDVYVIVESLKDETVNICKKYNATVFLRKKLNLQRKGYALDEAVKYILNTKSYDAYFIFDADNILDKNYLKNMIPVFDKGYDLASGYRNCKNGNESVVAASSALTFSLVNTVFNSIKNKKTKNITFSGTGFYIRGEIIDELKGYPFNSLTEDYELSSYAILNNLTTYYNTKSVFYDEQPVKYKDTINQRIRWIKGYFDVRKKYSKKIIKSISKDGNNNGSKIDEGLGIIPYIFIIIGIVLWYLSLAILTIYNFVFSNGLWKSLFLEFLIFSLIIYLALFIMSLVIVILEGKKINLTTKSKIKVLFYNPVFMISYIPCAIKALLKKDVKWVRVEHSKTNIN